MGVSGGPTLCWACPTDVNMTAHGPETISNERPKSDSWDLEIMCLRVKLDEKIDEKNNLQPVSTVASTIRLFETEPNYKQRKIGHIHDSLIGTY